MWEQTESLVPPTQHWPLSQSSRGAWNADSAGVGADVSRVAAIEVYPAATLVSHRIRSSGYKKRDQTEQRREIVDALRARLTIGESVRDLTQSADLVDAAVCVSAGSDFVSGRAMGPEDRTLAEREGWIWTAAPND